MTLISAYDVVRLFPMRGTTDPARLQPFLQLVEDELANGLLGTQFYADLVADLADLSSATPYSASSAYVLDDLVIHQHLAYQATQAVPANQAPPNTTYWKEADRFQTDQYQVLWSHYLCQLIAWKVAYSSLHTLHYDVGEQGIQKRLTNSSEAINRRELADLKTSLAHNIENWERVMDSWIKAQTGNAFTNYVGRTEQRVVRRQRRRHHGFNLKYPLQ